MPAMLRLVIVSLMLFATPVLCKADYMSAELRQMVEGLKRDYQTQPTTPETYPSRAAIAWKWLNAYALNGGSLPVNMTASIRPNPAVRAPRRYTQGLDASLNELTLLDEFPDAIGELTADTGPFEARSWVSLQQRYQVGERAISPGGGFLVARHFMPGYGQFQLDNPSADNYVSISSTNPDVSFVPDEVPFSGMHGGFRGPIPAKVFRLASGTLKQGDRVTITYGDKSGGSRGFLISSASTDFLPLPIYLKFDESGAFYSLPIQPVRVSGSSVAGVHGFAPSVVRPLEKFDLSIRAEDRFYNRAKAPIPAFKIYANGKRIGEVAASDKAITVKSISFKDVGVYHITIESEDGLLKGITNPILVSNDATRVAWGDTHGHSGFAEGIGTPDRFMQWAKDDARLDFVTHSEHDIWLDDREWQVLIDSVENYSEAGRFIGYLGYEWTTHSRFGGHHNVLFRDVDRRNRLGTQFYPTLSKLYFGLRENYATRDVLIIPHAHQSGDYTQNDPEMESLVEIMSQHGTFEWFGRMYLTHGHRVGFIAASDNHLSQPGYTSARGASLSQRGGLAAVRTNDISRNGMFDAMKSLKTYATTGDRIILDVRLNGIEMGQQAPFNKERNIEGRVIGTAPIDSITLVKNDEQIWHKNYLIVESGRYQKEETFYISFESDSFPMHKHDNPRGSHVWDGTLRLTGADIVKFEATDHHNPEFNILKRHGDTPGSLRFSTASRGDASSIRLDLANVKKNARIEFKFNQARESGGGPPFYRRHALIPASDLRIRFKDMKGGVTSKEIALDIYKDRVTLRRVIKEGSKDISFRFEDTGSVQGDYYFVRVRQANDALAWSSPIWVGGHRPR